MSSTTTKGLHRGKENSAETNPLSWPDKKHPSKDKTHPKSHLIDLLQEKGLLLWREIKAKIAKEEELGSIDISSD